MRDHDEMDCELIAAPLRRAEVPDPTFDARLQVAIRSAIVRGEVPWFAGKASTVTRAERSWFMRPRHVALSPLVGLAAAAGFAAIVVGATLTFTTDRTPTTAAAAVAPRDGENVVRFAISAPHAAGVSLVGDFNGWDAKATPLESSSANGVWTVTVPLAAGSYQYAFVIDGTAWVADPAAPLALEDEFGASSSLMIVQGGRT